MARGYAPGGPMTPFYIFPCDHAFHAQCLIAHVTRCTSQSHVSWICLMIYSILSTVFCHLTHN